MTFFCLNVSLVHCYSCACAGIIITESDTDGLVSNARARVLIDEYSVQFPASV